MNAIEAAKRLDYKQSVVFREDLRVSADPLKTYAFNARAALDAKFAEKLADHLPTILRRNGFEEFASVPVGAEAVRSVRLTEEEWATLEPMQRMAKEYGTTAFACASEGPMAEEGAGHAAAVCAVVVAIVVLVLAEMEVIRVVPGSDNMHLIDDQTA